MHNVACVNGTVTFQTQNNFKQNNEDPGKYEVSDALTGSVLTSDALAFEPHWAPTSVTVDVSDAKTIASVAAGDNITVAVTNKWGDVGSETVACS